MTVKRKSRSKKSIIKNIVPVALMVTTLLLINHFIPVFLKMNGSKTSITPSF